MCACWSIYGYLVPNFWVLAGNAFGLVYNTFALMVAHSLAPKPTRALMEYVLVCLVSILLLTGLVVSLTTARVGRTVWGIMSNILTFFVLVSIEGAP